MHRLLRVHVACGRTWRQFHSGATRLGEMVDNPFFSKYKDKLKKVQGQHGFPSTEKVAPEKRPRVAESAAPQCGSTRPPSLDSIMKVELLADRDREEISKIWVDYHKTKDCISGTMEPSTFVQLQAKAAHCPLFVFPLPRQQGYEFFFSQFHSPGQFYLTSLGSYRQFRENAPPCLTLTYYTDLLESKGVVLILGEVDMNILTTLEAQFLANQVLLYYSSSEGTRYDLVRQFNHTPNDFDFQSLLDQLQHTTLSQQSHEA